MIETGMSLHSPRQGKYKIVSTDPDLCTDFDFATLADARGALEDWPLECMDEDCLPVIVNRRGRVYSP